MDFAWDEQQREFRAAVIDFARRNLNGDLTGREDSGAFARDLWQKCAEFGIQGLPFPEQYAGSNQDVVTTMLAMEALGYACSDHGLLFSIHAHMWSVAMPILMFGTDEQKSKYLTKLCDGTWVGAHAMSEPDSGSDAFGLRTRAERKGDRYILNGTKMFVTNAPVGDVFLAFATVDRNKGMWGVTGFLIEKGTKGLTVSKPIEKMGLKTSPMAEVILEDCEVPAENLLGREGLGATIFNHSMGWERSCILASDVGAMERLVEKCVCYAKERQQFGKPLGSFQLVAAKIADMKVRLEASKLLLYQAAWSQSEGKMSALDAAIAKLFISEAAVQCGLDAIQLHGGYGYMKEFEVERELRNALGGRLYSGTSEIQKLIIARQLGLTPKN